MCLDAPMSESHEGIIHLPEDEPAVLDYVVYYLYRQQFECSMQDLVDGAYSGDGEFAGRDYEDVDDLQKLLAKVYLFADKTMAEEIQNEVIDGLRDYFRHCRLREWMIKLALDRPKEDQFRRLMQYNLAGEAIMDGYDAFKEGTMWHRSLSKDPMYLEFMLEGVMRWKDHDAQWMMDRAVNIDACEFHWHKISTHCGD
jgi:hypothetical protein